MASSSGGVRWSLEALPGETLEMQLRRPGALKMERGGLAAALAGLERVRVADRLPGAAARSARPRLSASESEMRRMATDSSLLLASLSVGDSVRSQSRECPIGSKVVSRVA